MSEDGGKRQTGIKGKRLSTTNGQVPLLPDSPSYLPRPVQVPVELQSALSAPGSAGRHASRSAGPEVRGTAARRTSTKRQLTPCPAFRKCVFSFFGTAEAQWKWSEREGVERDWRAGEGGGGGAGVVGGGGRKRGWGLGGRMSGYVVLCRQQMTSVNKKSAV